ncbi:hypothetical protein CP03DC35_1112A, partial [Chlamydia psittaci 03DC35]
MKTGLSRSGPVIVRFEPVKTGFSWSG